MLVKVDVRYGSAVTGDERGQIEAWVAVNDCSLISRISISRHDVTMDGVEGPFRARTGSAVRRGDLIDDLTEAHFTLSRALRWHLT